MDLRADVPCAAEKDLEWDMEWTLTLADTGPPARTGRADGFSPCACVL